MAWRTARFEFLDNCVSALVIVRAVVEFEEVGTLPIGALVAMRFHHDAFLSGRCVALPTRRIDRSAFGIVEQQANERAVELAEHRVAGRGRAVIEGEAVAAHMHHHLGDEFGVGAQQQRHEGVGSLLRQTRNAQSSVSAGCHRRRSSRSVAGNESPLFSGRSTTVGDGYSRAPLSKLSARRILAMLRRVLDYAERLELVTRNPAARLDAAVFGESRSSRTLSLSAPEAATLYEAAEGEWIVNYVRLGLWIGARPSELAALQLDAVDLETGRVEIRRSRRKVDGGYAVVDALKTDGSMRMLQVPAGAVEVLTAQRSDVLAAQVKATKWPHPELVFPTRTGTLLDPPKVRRELKRICKTAGLPEFGPNALRHSVASLLAQKGKSPAERERLLQ